MNTAAWILGILYSLGMLALKVGAGAAFLSGRGLLAATAVYLALFAAIGAGLEAILAVPAVEGIVREGTTLHLVLSTGLVLWGIYTLMSVQPSSRGPRLAPWGLVVPCPVCASAILVSVSVGVTATGRAPILVASGLAAFFLVAAAASRAVFRRLRDREGTGLGVVLVAMGLYFLVLLAVAPIWPQAEKMARQGTAAGGTLSASLVLGTLGAAAGLVLAGLVVKLREVHR